MSRWQDFDGGLIGNTVEQALTAQYPPSLGLSKINWQIIPPSRFPGGVEDLAGAVLDEKVWVAVSGEHYFTPLSPSVSAFNNTRN